MRLSKIQKDLLRQDFISFKENLYEREIEILQALLDGATHIETGRKLNISPNCVSAREDRLFSKLYWLSLGRP